MDQHNQPIISISNLTKSYGDKEVLHQLNLEIMPGEIIGYIGPNGAGKSTTVKVLIGINADYTGSAKVHDLEIKENLLEVKKLIGYVPEVAELYDLLTPNEFLSFVGKLYLLPDEVLNERMKKYLDLFQMSEHQHQRMDSFSKGMKQKILLTSGLIHDPQIVFLDEPLSGLDANAVIVVKELLQDLKKEGKTIFYCSHMMDVVEKVSDRIVLIDKGTIIANGTFESLKQHPNESLEDIFSRLTIGQTNHRIDEVKMEGSAHV